MEVLPPRSAPVRKPLFVTFYSFKGGVGRTMALLNTAAILAGLGKRVLMIDFDLEAPGLTLFQDRQLGAGTARQQAGLVDALGDFLEAPGEAPLADEEPTRFLEAYAVELDVPEALRRREGGRLEMIPSGQLDADYERRLYHLSFDKLFEEGVGVPLFERLKALLREADRYDYVLIDSRTGFSDEGSICTRYLADYLIVLTGLNRQNLRGTVRFLEQSGLGRQDERKKRIALVASPVPLFYEELRAERMAIAERALADVGLDGIRFTAEIPYHPLLALDEDPRVHSFAKTPLYEAYEEIVETLRTWAGDRPELRLQEALDMFQRGQVEQAVTQIREVREEDPERVLRTLLSVAGVLIERQPRQAARVLEEGLAVARERSGDPRLGSLLSYVAGAYYNLGEVGRAVEHYEQALAVSREIDDRRGEGNALGSLGNAYEILGEVGRAIAYHEQALAIHREIGDRHGESADLGNLGNAYFSLGEVHRAVAYYEQALAIHRETGDRRGEGIALGNLGIALARLGRGDEAAEAEAEARRLAEELGLPPLRAAILVDEAEAWTYMDPERALSHLDEAWDSIATHAEAFDRARAHVLRARLRAEQGDREGAAEDAQAALAFYREQGVDSVWSREAESLMSSVQA